MSQIASVVNNGVYSLQRMEERVELIGNSSLILDTREYGIVSIDGITSNVSKSGACVYISHRLEKGLELTLSGKVFGARAGRGAKVVWCEQLDLSVFKVGISFEI